MDKQMTEKQNHFTYTDNTSDNNDKIMENLHKQIIIDGCPDWKTIRGIVRNHKLNPDWKDIIEEFNRRLDN